MLYVRADDGFGSSGVPEGGMALHQVYTASGIRARMWITVSVMELCIKVGLNGLKFILTMMNEIDTISGVTDVFECGWLVPGPQLEVMEASPSTVSLKPCVVFVVLSC